MQQSGANPDPATIISMLLACAYLAALQPGEDIHEYIIKNRFESDVSVGNSLVAM